MRKNMTQTERARTLEAATRDGHPGSRSDETTLHAGARLTVITLLICAVLGVGGGCRSTLDHRGRADRAAQRAIAFTQQRALGRTEPVDVGSAAETLRRRLLLDGNLPHSGAASLGVRDLPDSEYWKAGRHLDAPSPANPGTSGLMGMRLVDALQIGARNSREYQEAKEQLFRAALKLDLESHEFRTTFAGALSSEYSRDGSGEDPVDALLETGNTEVSRKLPSGVELAGGIVVDLVQLLTLDAASAVGLSADASISIPLLRGAGRLVAAAPLRQAEQNLLYEVYAFERFKRVFAVRIANEYLGVLREGRQMRNAEENYRRLIAAGRRARRLADAGRLPEFQLDQAVQDELRARTRWVESQQGYASRLDGLKLALGLPPDTDISPDPEELDRIASPDTRFAARDSGQSRETTVPPADAPIELQSPTRADAGPLEIDAGRATQLALTHRLDLRTAKGRVEDAQREVMVAADALRGEITLLGRAAIGERRNSSGSASSGNAALDFARGIFSGWLTIDLPLDRTSERVSYRASLVDLERTVRDLQELEDRIKLDVRTTLRDLLQAREAVRVQRQAVTLAEKRVRSTDMFLQAGRAQVRDVLESQEALLNAQNALAAAAVSHRIAELTLQRDLGLLQVGVEGLWTEYTPTEDAE